jgi:predicted ATPase
MSNYFVIEGQAGAGKTPLIKEMVEHLNSCGYKAVSCAPFTLANQWIKSDQYPLGIYHFWHESIEKAREAEFILKKYMDDILKEQYDIVIFDRGWLTICMGLLESALPENEKIERINFWKGQKQSTFFLDTDPQITQNRQSWNPMVPWTNENIDTDFNNRRMYIQEYSSLLGRHKVVENRIDLVTLAKSWSEIIVEELSLIDPVML